MASARNPIAKPPARIAAPGSKEPRSAIRLTTARATRHRRPQDDLSFPALERTDLRQNTRGDADRGRRQGRADEDRRQRARAERASQGIAAQSRKQHSRHRDQDRGAPDLHELAEIGLQADFEEEEDHADLGENEDLVRQRHEPDQRRPEDDARQQLAEDRRLSDPLGQLAEELGADQRRREGEEKRADVEGVIHISILTVSLRSCSLARRTGAAPS
jgi:hypothetical protein